MRERECVCVSVCVSSHMWGEREAGEGQREKDA